jgi:leucyl-tRNA synthetase
MDYHFRKIEEYWQKYWAEKKTFAADNNSSKPKYYVLDMFPYPSGAGLHVGHPLGYIASDIMARYKRHKGFNVLHPMGYDSFGLPAEQYAIQTGQHPKITTDQNIARYREQLDKIGFSFDWDREVRTSEPSYYKWTQWIFLQLFNSWYNKETDKAEKIETLISEFEKNGNAEINACCDEDVKQFSAAEWKAFSEKERSDALMHYRIAYLGEAYVNWCPALGTVLANDEVKDGVSERGGHPVERKLMKQWSMRITAYAQRLLDGLEKIDWPESLKESQRYWLGRSEGTSLKFGLFPNPSPKEKGTKPGWQTADPTIYAALKQFARSNRQPQTEAEDKLWQALRNRQVNNAKFRRQHAIATYIADFVCLEKSLIIEVDGEIHNNTKETDAQRTAILNKIGFDVIRFTNKEIFTNFESVLSVIKTKLNNSPSPLERGPGGEAEKSEQIIEVFTTRPDTIFGVSFVTLAPEHELVNKITTPEQKAVVDDYVTKAKNRSERERQADVNKVSGVFTGAYVEHPFSGKAIPVWIGDYVLAGYGTGAVMAVPAHDERDFKFAAHFGLEKPQVIVPPVEHDLSKASWDEKEGKLINSDFLNGLDVKTAIKTAIERISKENLGKGKVNFRLRDAVFGRQRYWGEPIPIYYKDGIPQALPENELPLVLPEVDKFLPTEDGEPPLARAKDWKYKGQYDYEWTTMPGWAGSSWYFLRYMDAHNSKEFVNRKLADYWGQVDLYIGGSEHATGHLLYVRFWTKFLFDIGEISVDEPAQKLINQGMIQGTSCIVHRVNNENKIVSAGLKDKYDTTAIHIDVNIADNNVVDIEALKKWRDDFANTTFELENGKLICSTAVEKMSKRWYNVVTPDSICERFGADTLRLYEMFLGPLEQSKPWNTNGITGVSGFLKKLWKLYVNVNDEAPTKAELKTLHKTIKKITEDIERFSFNTSVSNFMICVNELTDLKCNKRAILEPLLILVSPYAPHIAEELWKLLGHNESIAYAPFPMFNETFLVEDNFNYPVSFNGKTRFNIELPATLSNQEVERLVLEAEQTKKYLEGKAPKKVIVVPKKIVNIVV